VLVQGGNPESTAIHVCPPFVVLKTPLFAPWRRPMGGGALLMVSFLATA
jgi:hypothetical protein